MVDLDAAFGRGSSADLLAGITGRLDVDVELSGGIRGDASLERALDTGYRRVNIGTAALERPQWCERIVETHGDRIAIGLGVRGERFAARGQATEGRSQAETPNRLVVAGCRRFAVTDVNSDGMLTDPNLDLLGDVCVRTDAAAIASGGTPAPDDLRALREFIRDGVEGAIIGTAFYLGGFILAEAIKVVDPQQTGETIWALHHAPASEPRN